MAPNFAAVRESGFGPSRHIAAPRDLGRERRIAEFDRQPFIEGNGAFDP
jgi:hypothetical protein